MKQLPPNDIVASVNIPPNPHAAFVAMQAEITNPPKTKTANVGKFSYKYADLADIIDHIRPLMAKHGFSFSQGGKVTAMGVFYSTQLVHISGLYLEHCEPMPSFPDPQAKGIWITYTRRYQLLAALGITGDDDTDGIHPGPVDKAPYKPATAPKPTVTPQADPKPAAAPAAKAEPSKGKWVCPPEQRKAIYETLSLQMGMDEATAISYMRQVTGKQQSSEWSKDDVARLHAAIESWKP